MPWNRQPAGPCGCEVRWIPQRWANGARRAQRRGVHEYQGRTDPATAQFRLESTDGAFEVASSQLIGPTPRSAAPTLSCVSRNADTPVGGCANCPIPGAHRLPENACIRNDGISGRACPRPSRLLWLPFAFRSVTSWPFGSAQGRRARARTSGIGTVLSPSFLAAFQRVWPATITPSVSTTMGWRRVPGAGEDDAARTETAEHEDENEYEDDWAGAGFPVPGSRFPAGRPARARPRRHRTESSSGRPRRL
jgi:hypothetical protein